MIRKVERHTWGLLVGGGGTILACVRRGVGSSVVETGAQRVLSMSRGQTDPTAMLDGGVPLHCFFVLARVQDALIGFTQITSINPRACRATCRIDSTPHLENDVY